MKQLQRIELQFKKEITDNMRAFESINVKYLQHNQVGALASIYDYLQDEEKSKGNLFIKMGTGQGKSLTMAETVRKIVHINEDNNRQQQQIFIMTFYDHLAKRDYENYKKYYQFFYIRPMYCSSGSATNDFYDKDVIYVDSATYFKLLGKEGYNALIESTSIHIPNYRDVALIMDEFDSLALDSDEILQNTFYFDFKKKGQIGNLDSIEAMKKIFDVTFIGHCNTQLPKLFDRWCRQILENKKRQRPQN